MIKIEQMPACSKELEKLIVERCSQYGTVLGINIHSSDSLKPLARVTMATTTAKLEVARKLGELIVDDVVLIRIEH